MKKIFFYVTLIMSFSSACTHAQQETKNDDLEWKLSMQSYTLHRFTVVEALEKTQQLGLEFIEIYPGQRMGEAFDNATFGYDLSRDHQEQLKELASSKGITIVSSGVWTAQREEWEKIFEFADNMDMEFISAEPALTDWDVVENLAVKHGIKVAVHNHPSESSYWKPDILLSAIEGRSDLLGSSADIGHYKRMGLDPLECIKQLEGKIISFHFKDIAPVGTDETLEDVVWGTGVLQIDEILKELRRQHFEGYFTIEYEANWENNLPEIRESIDYFNEVVNNLN